MEVHIMKYDPVKVLVVEDEILLLNNIKKKIAAASSDFQVSGDAFNGKEALALIKKIHPDVIFTDIRMPVMDGLELAKTVYNDYPDIYIVIISGYDDFDYARTALQYRVYDYLLKPLKLDALAALLNSLGAEIRKKRDHKLYSLLYGQLNNNQLPPSDLPFIREIAERKFTCFLVCFGNLHTHCQQSALPDQNQADSFSCLPWEALFASAPFDISDFWVFPQQFDNIKLILTGDLNSSPQDVGLFIQKSLIQLLSGPNVTLACGQSQVSFSHLHSEWVSLRKLLFSSLIIGSSSLLPKPGPSAVLPPAVFPAASISYFYSLIHTSNTAGFMKALKPMFQEWEENRYPQQWIEKMLMQLFTILQQCLYFSDLDYEQMQSAVYFSLETQPTLSDGAERIIQEFVYWIKLNKSVPSEIETAIEEMDSYIRLHYKESINIAELAKNYHFNHSYLTRVFKKQKGQSPLKLINELRIHDACELLSDSVFSIKEISEMLGFTDQHYFSRIFKDFTGQNPKEYRSLLK